MTDAPESEEEETLLLKLVQSLVERQPKVAEEAVLQVREPLVVLRPVPMALNDVPFKVMRVVETLLVNCLKVFLRPCLIQPWVSELRQLPLSCTMCLLLVLMLSHTELMNLVSL